MSSLVPLKRGSQTIEKAARKKYRRSHAAPSAGQMHMYSTTGVLSNAQNTVFNGPVHMSDINQSGHPATIHRLAEKAKPEAIHSSAFREYMAKCSENTRVSIRKDIVEWWGNSNRQSRLRWYMGPAAIGKSAIADIIATELEELALMNAYYKRIITELLVDDPLLLTKNRAIQFKKLIVEPFQTIMAKDTSTVDNPLLIILNGLDECKGRQVQEELALLVLNHIQLFKHFPLVWLIFSHPEWHLKTLVSDIDFLSTLEKREISVDDEEAIADARRLLEGELAKVRRQYLYLPSDWPAREDVNRLCKAASGHLGYVSFMARFISDKEVADPERRFLICTRVASGLGVDQGTLVNPLEALDCLYHRVLSDVPADLLPTATKIFATIVNVSFKCSYLASFLLLTEGQLFQALQQLHAIVYVPPTNGSSSQSLRFFHASFVDFLDDQVRSEKFHLSFKTMYYDLIVQSLRWLEKNGDELSTGDVDLILDWKLSAELTLTSRIRKYTSQYCRPALSGSPLVVLQQYSRFKFA
ncbi:hypothetical protein NP233_g9888 [Leucocoprinus birnbaumii]|uniref:NACHT domain-containing protein n=1 Tax=Leucocoprinus birnbaumii TaxID=56174 RepID=A0AAD5VLB7_9AGAR|nr:hypothetical protein NP233_g9888 [Leucocoprinus birnbaumii]